MSRSYRTRVCVRRFLNRPGFHAGAYVLAEVQDTSELAVREQDGRLVNPRPHLRLEIADCSERIDLEFAVHSAEHVRNSLHKLDTLAAALARFRAGLLEEAALHRKRQRLVARREREQQEAGTGASPPPPSLSGRP
jgi:hypothetical protein